MPASLRTADATALPRPTADHRVFLRTLDVLTEGLAFFDLAANLLHANEAFREAVENAAPDPRLGVEIGRLIEALCSAARQRVHTKAAEEDHVETLIEQEVATSVVRYRLRGSYIGFDLFGSGATVLVTLQRPAILSQLSDETLHERFGLSRSESRVARLIAAGRSNSQIAGELEISPHTARNHTSHVMAKLRVRSRAEVGPKLRGE